MGWNALLQLAGTKPSSLATTCRYMVLVRFPNPLTLLAVGEPDYIVQFHRHWHPLPKSPPSPTTVPTKSVKPTTKSPPGSRSRSPACSRTRRSQSMHSPQLLPWQPFSCVSYLCFLPFLAFWWWSWWSMIIDHKFTILPLFSSRHIISLARELFVYCRFLDRLHLDPVATKVTVEKWRRVHTFCDFRFSERFHLDLVLYWFGCSNSWLLGNWGRWRALREVGRKSWEENMKLEVGEVHPDPKLL